METKRQTQLTPSRPGVRSNRGQVIALYAIAIPVLLGVMALALDGGKLFVSKIHVQNAADAAALAASQDVGSCADGSCAGLPAETTIRTTVEQDVNSYSSNNGGPVALGQCVAAWYAENASQRHVDPVRDPTKPTGCYTWPYIDGPGHSDIHWDKVEVRIRKPVNLSFASIVGFHNPAYPFARSVGAYQLALLVTSTPGTTVLGYVLSGQTRTTVYTGQTHSTTTVTPGQTHTTTNVTGGTCPVGSTNCGVGFAMSAQCDAITYSGAGGGSIGSFETNGGFQASGNAGKKVDSLYLGKYPGKDANGTCYQNGGVVTLAHGPFGPFSPQNWPISLPNVPARVPVAGHPALVGNQCWDISSAGIGAATTPGVYCSTGALSLTKSFIGYTFFASCISVSGSNNSFKYATGLNAAQGARLQTVFYASGTDVSCGAPPMKLQGSTNSITGDMFAPNGQMSAQGGGASGGGGFIEAQTISINGNNFGYLGNGPLQGSSLTTVTTTDPSTTSVIFTTDPNTTNVTTDPDTVVTGSTIPGTLNTATTGTNIGLGE
jgi:Putative Flp pilus-assembly TadE/G-like